MSSYQGVQIAHRSLDTAAEAKFRPVFSRVALAVLVALLRGETTIKLNYIDRQVVSVLAPTLRAEFSLSNGEMRPS